MLSSMRLDSKRYSGTGKGDVLWDRMLAGFVETQRFAANAQSLSGLDPVKVKPLAPIEKGTRRHFG